MAAIGIFPGTFDPVHQGHLAFAMSALTTAGLDSVVLMPEAIPRGKPGVMPLAHRLAMLELAVAGQPQLAVLQLHTRQFTVAEALPELRRLFPKDTLSLLVGSDVLRGLACWPDADALLADMQLLVAPRAHDTPAVIAGELRTLQRAFPDVPLRAITVAGTLYPEAASSHIRGKRAPVHHLAEPVAAYITRYRLYEGLSVV